MAKSYHRIYTTGMINEIEIKKQLAEILSGAQTIRGHADYALDYADGLDPIAMRKALKSIRDLSQAIIDRVEGY